MLRWNGLLLRAFSMHVSDWANDLSQIGLKHVVIYSQGGKRKTGQNTKQVHLKNLARLTNRVLLTKSNSALFCRLPLRICLSFIDQRWEMPHWPSRHRPKRYLIALSPSSRDCFRCQSAVSSYRMIQENCASPSS